MDLHRTQLFSSDSTLYALTFVPTTRSTVFTMPSANTPTSSPQLYQVLQLSPTDGAIVQKMVLKMRSAPTTTPKQFKVLGCRSTDTVIKQDLPDVQMTSFTVEVWVKFYDVVVCSVCPYLPKYSCQEYHCIPVMTSLLDGFLRVISYLSVRSLTHSVSLSFCVSACVNQYVIGTCVNMKRYRYDLI